MRVDILKVNAADCGWYYENTKIYAMITINTLF